MCPYWLLGLLLVAVLIYYFFRSLSDLPKKQCVVSLLVRGLVLVLLVLSLAGLTLLKPTKEQFVVFAVDRSMSIGEEGKKAADDFLAKAIKKSGRNRYAILPFAAEPGSLESDRPRDDRSSKDAKKELDAKGTNLAEAIEVAAASRPPFYVPKIVLVSDGNPTKGEVLKSALRAGASISTVPLPVRNEPEVQVSGINVPAQVRQGEPFRVEVVVDSNHDDEGEIEVFKGPIKVVSEKRKIKKGENKFQFNQQIENDRLAAYSVRVKGFKDTLLDNNSDLGLVFTNGKPRVLIIESDPKSAKHLTWCWKSRTCRSTFALPRACPTISPTFRITSS